MLWLQKTNVFRLLLAACTVLSLPTILYYQIPRYHRSRVQSNSTGKQSFKPKLPTPDNAPLVEHIEEEGVTYNKALEGGPRIRQASMLFGGEKKGESALYERAVRTHIQHGERWGYSSHILRQDIVGKGDWKVLVFGKLLYLQSLIVQEMARPDAKRAEWLVWFDADTILLNQNIPWEIFLPPTDEFPDIHFLGNKDWNGYNCGVFFLRVNEWSVNFLTEASALPLLRPEIEIGEKASNYEQDAMPREWYDAYYEGEHHELEYQRGDMMIHFAGTLEKHDDMGRWLDRVDQDIDGLQMPISNLAIRADIAQFWTDVDDVKRLLERASDLQSNDKLKHTLADSPEIGDEFRRAKNELQIIYQDTPYLKDVLQKARSRLDGCVKAVLKAHESS